MLVGVGSTGTLVSSDPDRSEEVNGEDTLQSTDLKSTDFNGETSVPLVNEDEEDDHIPMSIAGELCTLALDYTLLPTIRYPLLLQMVVKVSMF